MGEWTESGNIWVWRNGLYLGKVGYGGVNGAGIVRFMGGDRALEFLNSGARKRGLFLEIVEY